MTTPVSAGASASQLHSAQPTTPTLAPDAAPASQPTPAYNWVYKELVKDPNDVVGAVAYALYKQDKIAFIEATVATHNRQPTDDELRVFHTQTCVQAKIGAYLAQAEQLGQAFLNAGLAKRIVSYEEEVRESVINQNVSAVLTELKARKGIVAWLGEMVSSLGVNVATILVIGALLGGYQALSRFNSILEKLSKIAVVEEPEKATAAPSALPAPANPLAPANDSKGLPASADKAQRNKTYYAAPAPQG